MRADCGRFCVGSQLLYIYTLFAILQPLDPSTSTSLLFCHNDPTSSRSTRNQTRYSELVFIEFDIFLNILTSTTLTIPARQPPRIPSPLRAVSIFAGPRSLARGRAGSQSVCSMKRLGEGVDEEFVVGWLTGWRGGASGEVRMGFGIV